MSTKSCSIFRTNRRRISDRFPDTIETWEGVGPPAWKLVSTMKR
jgi:hypothetical protein